MASADRAHHRARRRAAASADGHAADPGRPQGEDPSGRRAGRADQDLGFDGAQIGKINVNEFSTYVAVERGIADQALRKLNAGKVKGKSVKVRLL